MHDDTAPRQTASPPSLVIHVALEQPLLACFDTLNEGEELRLREEIKARGLVEPFARLGVRVAA
jgi:hypothetical protein